MKRQFEKHYSAKRPKVFEVLKKATLQKPNVSFYLALAQLDFLKVARFSLNGPGTNSRSLARALTIALRASKQGTRQRFALFELDL